MSDQVLLESQTAQRESAKAESRRQAKLVTRDQLFSKKPRWQIYEFQLEQDSDTVSMRMEAVPPKAYDKLVAAHAPTPAQEKKGYNINPDTFCPTLLSRVVKEPALPLEDWVTIWESGDWSTGELQSLYGAANELCNRGLDLVPFDVG